jgi:hypothetical protein
MSTPVAFFSDEEIKAIYEPPPPFPPFDRDSWLQKGSKLGQDHGDKQWAIGKWLDEGLRGLGNKGGIAEAMRVTQISRPTLWDYARTFECFRHEDSRRRELSWSHHKEVSIKALTDDKRAELLKSAAVAEPHWSLQRLRTVVKNELKKDKGKGDTQPLRSLTVKVNEDTYRYLQQEARSSAKNRAEFAGELLDKYVKTQL